MRDSKRSLLFPGLAWLSLALAAVIWHFAAQSRSTAMAPCPAAMPGGLDRQHLVVLDSQGLPPADSRQAAFLEDLEELLLAGRYQVISAGCEAARMPLHCIPWRLELALAESGRAEVSLVIRRYGELVESSVEQVEGGEAPILPGLRRAIATRLAIAGEAASLHAPSSAAFRDRQRALRRFAEGSTGEAAAILRQAVARDPGDAALRWRLGQILAGWSGEMRTALPPRDEKRGPGDDPDHRALLEEAGRHLDRSLAADEAAKALVARGRVAFELGRDRAAEADLVKALEIWPAASEATRELVRARLASLEIEGLERLLKDSLLLLDVRQAELRATLLRDLGEVHLLRGNGAAAEQELLESLAAAPAERRLWRAQTLALLAGAQTRLGKVSAACESWRLYAALIGGNQDPDEACRKKYLAAMIDCGT